MKKSVLIFGLVLGTILCANMIYMVNLFYTDPEFKGNDMLGFAIMGIVFLTTTYFGIRNYRNKQPNGKITFGKAFKTGALIVLTASTMYVVAWLFYYYLFVPDFIDKYIPHALKDVPASDLAEKTKEMEDFRENYKNPFFVIATTYMEVLPIGLVLALISSLILKKKPNQMVSDK